MSYRDVRIAAIVVGCTVMSFTAAYAITRVVCEVIFV